MHVIIFGASGNSGRYLTESFLRKGHEVTGVSRSPSGVSHVNFREVRADIRNRDSFSQIQGSFDLAVNFAAIQPSILNYDEGVDRFKASRDYIESNVHGLINVVEFVRNRDVSTYVFASSHRELENHWSDGRSLVDDLDVSINVKGDHAIYAISKVTGRWVGEYLLTGSSTRHFSLRLPMMFQIPENPYYLVAGEKRIMPFLRIIKDAIVGNPLEIWGDPELRRDYVHVENLVQMVELCFRSNLGGGTFNVGTGEGVSTERFVKTLGNRFSPDPSNLTFLHRPEKETYKRAVYDISLASAQLGYQPILFDDMVYRMKNVFEERNLASVWGWT